ncbi:histidine-specific methyltransferase [Xylaria cf. heliscus]|nr:histidine-specific methyltransferase [Xylaria cf. heliscus]
MSPIKIELEKQPQILDIRQGQSSFDLGEEIVNGMTCQPRSLPSLLLWDDKGLEHFNQLTQTPTYYPFHAEIEILRKYGSSIGSRIPANGMLLELGCGSIRKTKLLLSSLRKQNRPIHYFALDVSRESLESNLGDMRREYEGCHFITITGLLGTYDDCITWLSEFQGTQGYRSVTIMFLGNSFANMKSHKEASFFLERFSVACQRAHLACRFMVSTDICRDDTKVLNAYSLQEKETPRFLLHALESANIALDYKAFDPADWKVSGWLDNCHHTLHFYVTAKKDLLVSLPVSSNEIETVAICEGERVHLVGSGKWGEEVMGSISGQAGFQIQHTWKDGTGDYCMFLLTQETGW